MAANLRVALCSSALHTTPPIAYGSEITAWYMCEELCNLGHEVHLIAAEGSLKPKIGALHRMESSDERSFAQQFSSLLSSCDLTHDMSAGHYFADANHLEQDKHLTTINGISFVTPRYKHNVVVLSEAARRAALSNTPAWEEKYTQFQTSPGRLPSCEVVHYGTDTGFYQPCYEKDDYIVYIGRPHLSKGVNWILRLAELMPKQRFVLAWRAEHGEHAHYEFDYMRQALKLPNVEIQKLPIEGHHEVKRRLYQQAKAFIQPTQYIEAFGLTAIEALSCGTPIILRNMGSAGEILHDALWTTSTSGLWMSKSGFMCSTINDFKIAIEMLENIDGRDCRQNAVDKFDKSIMCSRYLDLYERVLKGEEW